jgi:cobalt-precorrin-7 (C5)-methyltransferase
MAHEGKRCVVCAWGDLNFSARELLDRVRQRVDEVTLIPGISSVQIACARLGLEMERSIFITLHARGANEDTVKEAVDAIKSRRRNVIMLPRPFDLMPADIAKLMVKQDVSPDNSVKVLQRLSLEDESVREFTVGSLSNAPEEFSDLTIMVFPLSE